MVSLGVMMLGGAQGIVWFGSGWYSCWNERWTVFGESQKWGWGTGYGHVHGVLYGMYVCCMSCFVCEHPPLVCDTRRVEFGRGVVTVSALRLWSVPIYFCVSVFLQRGVGGLYGCTGLRNIYSAVRVEAMSRAAQGRSSSGSACSNSRRISHY